MNRIRAAGLVVYFLLLLVCMAASMMLGAKNYSWIQAWTSIFHYDASVSEQMVIRTTRLPRSLIAAAIGASLAMAGALMQALTRNPLASPSVLGVNAGATFFVVTGALMLSVGSMSGLMWISFLGAAVGALSVYVLGSVGRGGLTPIKLILAGTAMTTLFASFTQVLLVMNRQGLNTVLFWLVGSIAGRSLELLIEVLPYMVVCWAAAFFLARDMNLLSMGEETAKGLGQRTVVVQTVTMIVIVILAGGSVAVSGPIGLVGIIIPHIARFIVGTDYRWLLPYCAVLGAILLNLADLVARFLIIPEEIPVGVMTAVIGAPFFIYIARRGRRSHEST